MEKRNKIKVAVLGASGFVGSHLVRLLHEHPFFELVALFASESSEGKKPTLSFLPDYETNYLNDESQSRSFPLKLEKFNLSRLMETGVEVVFSALPSNIAASIEHELREKGMAIFTNASAHRQDEDVPVVIPEVNPEHLEIIKIQKNKYGGFIVASSNCCVAGLVLSLKPLLAWGIKRITITTFQSISGAARDSLAAADILNNLFPFIPEEEEKISRETLKILGHFLNDQIIPLNFSLSAFCVRVPISLGHLLAVEVEFKTIPEIEEIEKTFTHCLALHRFDLPTSPSWPIIVRPEPDRPQPALDVWAGQPSRARGMAISLGRIRCQNNSVRYFLLVNNLIRGGAGNCLLTAELAYKLGYLS